MTPSHPHPCSHCSLSPQTVSEGSSSHSELLFVRLRAKKRGGKKKSLSSKTPTDSSPVVTVAAVTCGVKSGERGGGLDYNICDYEIALVYLHVVLKESVQVSRPFSNWSFLRGQAQVSSRHRRDGTWTSHTTRLISRFDGRDSRRSFEPLPVSTLAPCFLCPPLSLMKPHCFIK